MLTGHWFHSSYPTLILNSLQCAPSVHVTFLMTARAEASGPAEHLYGSDQLQGEAVGESTIQDYLFPHLKPIAQDADLTHRQAATQVIH